MSNSVDQRIVQMQFDNAQFEKGVAVTMASLRQLDQELQLKEGMAGIKNIDAAVSNVNLAGMSSALEEINSKFSIMGVVGATAIQRITNMVMDVGGQVAKGLTIQPLMDGLDEYNLKLNSIKTIQANTGLTGEEGTARINRVLQDLNEYADKTIYNFAEMTRNIGTFTAAGVGLEESATAIQGIANLAAMSGSNSAQASTAMYQLSQALATGTVKLMDWNSVVNAGMGGRVFQQALIETSRALKTGADEYIAAEGSFRDSLTHGWITAEVLTKTLRNFTLADEALADEYRVMLEQEGYNKEQINNILRTAQLAQSAATEVKSFSQLIDTTKEALGSGWAETWEYIQGDILQAQKLWTWVSEGLGDVIGGFDKVRNDFFRAWNTGGKQVKDAEGQFHTLQLTVSGWESMFKALQAIAGLIGDIIRPIAEAFEEVFHIGEGAEMAGVHAAYATLQFRQFFENLRKSLNESATGQAILNGLKTVFTALFTAIKVVVDILSGAFSVAIKVVGAAIGVAANAIEFFIAGIGNLIQWFESLDIGSVFESIADFFANTFDVPVLKNIVDVVSRLFDAFVGFISGTKGFGDAVKEGFEALGIDELLGVLRSNFAGLLDNAATALGNFASGIGQLVAKGAQSVFEGLSGAFSTFQQVWESVAPSFDNIQSVIESTWDTIKSFIGSIDLSPIMEFAQSNLPDFLKNLAEGITTVAGTVAGTIGFAAIEGLIWVFGQLQNAWNAVQPVFEAIKEKVTGAWNVVKEAFLSSGFSLEPFKDMFVKFGDAFNEFIQNVTENGFSFDALFELFGKLGDSVKELFDEIAPSMGTFVSIIGENLEGPLKSLFDLVTQLPDPLSLISSSLQTIGDVLSGFADLKFPWDNSGAGDMAASAVSSLEDISDVTLRVSDVITMIKNPMKTVSDFVANGLNGLLAGIDEFVNKLDGEKIQTFMTRMVQLGAMGGVVAGLYEFFQTLVTIRGFVKAVKSIPAAIGDVITNFNNVITDMRKNLKLFAVGQIALAIGILVGALFLLTQIDYDKLQQVAPYLAGIAAGVVAAMVIFSGIGMIPAFNLEAIAAFAAGMTALAIAVAAIAGVTVLLGLVPPEVVERGTKVLAGIVGMIALLSLLGSFAKGGYIAAQTMQQYAKVLAELAVIVAVLSFIPSDQAWTAVGVLTVLSLVMVGMAALMSLISNKLGGASITASIKGLNSLALVILSLAASIAILSLLPTDKMVASAVVLGILIGVLAMVVAGLSNFATDVAKVAEAAAMFVVLAAAIAILAACVGALAVIAALGGDVGVATEAIVFLVAAVAAAAYALSIAGPTMIGATAALINFAIVIGVLSAAIIAFSLIPATQLGVAVLTMLGAMLILVGAFALIGVIGQYLSFGIAMFSVFVDSIAFLAISIGAAALAIAVSMAILAAVGPDAAKSFVESLQIIGKGLFESIPYIAMGVAGLVLGILGGLALCIPGAMVILLGLVGAVVGVLISAAPIVGAGAVLMVAGIIDGFANGLEMFAPDVVNAVIHLGEVVVQGLLGLLSDGVNAFNNWLYDVTGGLMGVAPKVHDAADQTGQSYEDGLNKHKDGISNTVYEYKAKAAELANSMGGLTDTAGADMSQLQSMFGIDVSGEMNADTMTQGLPEEMRAMMSQYGVIGTETVNTYYEGAEQEAAAQGGLADIVGKIDNRFDENIGQAREAGRQEVEAHDQGVEEAAAESTSGETMFSMWESNLGEVRDNVVAFAEGAATDAKAAFSEHFGMDAEPATSETIATITSAKELIIGEADGAGSGASSAFSSSVSGMASGAQTAISNVVSAFDGLGDMLYQKAHSSGERASEGLASGIGSMGWRAAAAATSLANSVAATLNNALVVRSPSRVTMRTGEYFTEGFAIGIENMIPLAEEATETLGSAATASMLAQAAQIADALDEMDYEPTITPVLNLDDYLTGIDTMNSLLPSDQTTLIGRMLDIPASLNSHRNGSDTTVIYEINLNYTNDADANRIFSDLTREIRSKNLMEA